MLEMGGGQRKMSPQYGGIMGFLFIGQRTDGNGACHIGGALPILRAGVHQKETVIYKRRIARRRRLIVDDGAMGAGGNDGCKALPQIVGTGGAQAFQLVRNRQFRHGQRLRVQPAEQFCQRHAVIYVGKPHIFLFGRGFLCLAKGGGIGARHALNTLRQRAAQRHIHGVLVQQHAAAVGQSGQIRINLPVGPQGNAIFAQGGGQIRAEGGERGIEDSFLRCQQGVGHEYGVIGHIAAAQIEKPRNVIQRGQQMTVGAGIRHGAAQLRQLFAAALAGIDGGQLPNGRGREGQTVRPQFAHQISGLVKANVLLLQGIS